MKHFFYLTKREQYNKELLLLFINEIILKKENLTFHILRRILLVPNNLGTEKLQKIFVCSLLILVKSCLKHYIIFTNL